MRYVWLDLLRWVLASGVFFYHSLEGMLGYSPTWDVITRVGGLGILPFFVISGVAITLTLPRATPTNFVWNRIRRLLPALLFVSVLQVLVTLWSVRRENLDADRIEIILRDIFQGLLPLPNYDGTFTNFVTWTIAVEVRFYFLALLLLLIAVMFKKLITPSFIFAGLAAWLGLLYLNSYDEIPIINTLIIPIEGPFFALGVLFGLTVAKKIQVAKLVLLFILIIPLLAFHIYEHFKAFEPVNAFANTLYVGMSIVLVFVFLHVPNPPGKFLNGFLPEIGKASYPLYLLGGAFGMTLVRLPSISELGTPASQWLVYILISFVAVAFSRFIEPRFFPKLFPKHF